MIIFQVHYSIAEQESQEKLKLYVRKKSLFNLVVLLKNH
jgi:hypothetical protein